MLNSVVFMGRLTADPELRTTPNGVSVTTFTIAVDRPFQRGSAIGIDCGRLPRHGVVDAREPQRQRRELAFRPGVGDGVEDAGKRLESLGGQDHADD